MGNTKKRNKQSSKKEGSKQLPSNDEGASSHQLEKSQASASVVAHDQSTDNESGPKNIQKEAAQDKQKRTSVTIPTSVMAKLLGFTVLLFVLPLLTYFGCLNYIFIDSPTISAFLAAIVANIVVIGYVIVAWKEDQDQENFIKGKSKTE